MIDLVSVLNAIGSPRNFAEEQAKYKQLQEQGTRLNEIGNLRNMFAQGTPDKQALLSQIGQIDPYATAKTMLTPDKESSITGNKAQDLADRELLLGMSDEITKKAQSILQKRDAGQDVSGDMVELDTMIFKAKQFGKGRFNNPLNGILGRQLKERGLTLQEEKFGYTQAEDLEDDAKLAVKEWKSDNKDLLQRVKTIKILKGIQEQALAGNPTAIKNYIAGISRLGSNEALSDNELSIMLSGNVSEKFNKWLNEKFGSGAVIGTKDAQNAKATLDAYDTKTKALLNTEIDSGLGLIKSFDPATKKWNDDTLRGLLLQGTSQGKFNKGGL